MAQCNQSHIAYSLWIYIIERLMLHDARLNRVIVQLFIDFYISLLFTIFVELPITILYYDMSASLITILQFAKIMGFIILFKHMFERFPFTSIKDLPICINLTQRHGYINTLRVQVSRRVVFVFEHGRKPRLLLIPDNIVAFLENELGSIRTFTIQTQHEIMLNRVLGNVRTVAILAYML